MPAKRRRDVRVDRIGFVQELVKQWIEPKPGGVKARVKADMEVGEAVEGDFFFARLDASSETEISVSAVLKLYEQQAISRSELVEILTVRNEPARKILPPKTIQRISRTFVGTARLVVGRKEGVELKLADAVAKIDLPHEKRTRFGSDIFNSASPQTPQG